jgi:hypothetical protein
MFPIPFEIEFKFLKSFLMALLRTACKGCPFVNDHELVAAPVRPVRTADAGTHLSKEVL